MSQRSQTIRGAGQGFFGLPPRSEAQELLDGDHLDPNELTANLRDIRRVNHLLGGTKTTLRYLPELLTGIPFDQTVSILDLATGSADIPVSISEWAAEAGRAVAIVASDYSDEILAVAGERIAGLPAITLAKFDARDVPRPDRSFDVVLCALSLHHFQPDDAVLVRTADHGDLLGAHGGLHQKWFNLYDEATRVPFVIARVGAHRSSARTVGRSSRATSPATFAISS